ncbi:MAG: hypothetical protein KIT16_09985 [Rhodospirillaceae bacterium]|nr:hypothetical protein [Rhodospirillaceae bacterium]
MRAFRCVPIDPHQGAMPSGALSLVLQFAGMRPMLSREDCARLLSQQRLATRLRLWWAMPAAPEDAGLGRYLITRAGAAPCLDRRAVIEMNAARAAGDSETELRLLRLLRQFVEMNGPRPAPTQIAGCC